MTALTHKVAIRRNSDGVIRMVDGGNWNDCGEYMWVDGNYSCDCNRHLYFERAAGTELDWDDGGECGETRYSALYAELSDGRRINLDDDVQPDRKLGQL